MIKLIIFDLDGVLVDAKELHYEALNKALATVGSKYTIEKEEHLAIYDGLNTSKKLQMLSKQKNLPEDKHQLVWDLKQQKTIEMIKQFEPDHRIVLILQQLKKDGYAIAVASNSIRETIKLMLLKKGFMEYIDFFYSNQDVIRPKPNVEMYLRCMIKGGASPSETLIIEDSPLGRTAAANSGAHLLSVRNSKDLNYEMIKSFIRPLDDKKSALKWKEPKMKILIPMAGAGSRFEKAGFSFPKPLIPIKNMNDKPMIQVVVENLNIEAEFIFITRKEHYDKYNLKQLLNLIVPDCKIITIDHLTEGAACTTLLAKDLINNEDPLLIANSDQFIEWSSSEFIYSMAEEHIDGGILTFENSHPKWSYVATDKNGFVKQVKEKTVISNHATVGVYYWKRGSDYVKYSEQMISKGTETKINGEWYVCPVYQYAVDDGGKIKIHHINHMWGLGTPEDLDYFIKNYKF
jgi:HAD superfamily hydrolase (TIGR01509 family)